MHNVSVGPYLSLLFLLLVADKDSEDSTAAITCRPLLLTANFLNRRIGMLESRPALVLIAIFSLPSLALLYDLVLARSCRVLYLCVDNL